MVSYRKTIFRLLALEFHTSKLLLGHHNWKDFTYTPWLPYEWPYQLIYVIYRWILVLYFLIWLVLAGKDEGNARYFIYLTNWAHLLYNLYLVISALSVTLRFVIVHWVNRSTESNRLHSVDNQAAVEPRGYCNLSNNRISWYQMVHWLFFTIGNELAILVLILFWSLVYKGEKITGVSANTHLINGLLAVVDVCITGLPVNLLHCIYLLILSSVYSTFSGVYFIITGDNIYSVLDYKNHTGGAVGLYLSLTFLLLPAVHFLIFILHLSRKWVVYYHCVVRTWSRRFAQERLDENLELIDMENRSDPE